MFSQLSGELRSKGGFSVNVSTGERPTSGYMVSDVEGEKSRPLKTTRGRHIQAYAEEHKAKLKGANRFLGGWAERDVKPQQAVLDRSTRYPETPLGHGQAYVNMVSNVQRSAYHVSKDAYIANPAYEADPVKRMRRMQGRNVP